MKINLLPNSRENKFINLINIKVRQTWIHNLASALWGTLLTSLNLSSLLCIWEKENREFTSYVFGWYSHELFYTIIGTPLYTVERKQRIYLMFFCWYSHELFYTIIGTYSKKKNTTMSKKETLSIPLPSLSLYILKTFFCIPLKNNLAIFSWTPEV